MNQLTKIRINISKANETNSNSDSGNIIIMFQFITMIFIVASVSVVYLYIYNVVKKDLDFKTPLPVITLPSNSMNQSDQILSSLLMIEGDLEMSTFIDNFGDQSINKAQDNSIEADLKVLLSTKKSRQILWFKVSEAYKMYGTTYRDETTNDTKMTNHKYQVLVEAMKLPEGTSITPEIIYYTYEMKISKDNKLLSFKEVPDKMLLSKKQFSKYIKNITKEKILSSVSYSSDISALSLSKMNLNKITPSRLRMKKTVEGHPLGTFELYVGDNILYVEIQMDLNNKPIMMIR